MKIPYLRYFCPALTTMVCAASFKVAGAATLTGNTTIQSQASPPEAGNLAIHGYLLTLGSGASSGSLGGVHLQYSEDASGGPNVAALSSLANSTTPALWEWGFAYGQPNPTLQMSLDPQNKLTLYSTSSSGNMVFDPVNGQITIGTNRVVTEGSGLPVSLGTSTATGWHSTSMGYNTSASGQSSIAGGEYSSAYGQGSVALGYGVSAGQQGSSAFGYSSQAYGFASTAMGEYAYANGDCSLAVGSGSYTYGFAASALGSSSANGSYSTALGASYAGSDYSTAMGASNAYGYYSTAMGGAYASADYATATGTSNASGYYSTAMGSSNASGQNATALGAATASNSYATALGAATASGAYATALGAATATGSYATAAGYSASAGGTYSVALGYASSSPGSYSAAVSRGNSSGQYSTAMSYGVASGYYSMASGFQARATSYSSASFGRYNQSWGSSTGWVEEDPLFLVGNGTSSSPSLTSNAIATRKNGESTLTNKAWKANVTTNPTQVLADPPPSTDSGGNALVVDGHAILNGKVVISAPQGDISMGLYQ